MGNKDRLFCPHCGDTVCEEKEGDIARDFCHACEVFFYDNPLPVVSAIVARERSIAFVKRGNEPYKGEWCLPSGFVETGESIEEAALRELEEETGVQGRITSLVDVDSCHNYFYGDLIFITFEVEQIGGNFIPGDDAVAVQFFPVEKIPRLAFTSNTKAVDAYVKGKADYWAIVDSFALAVGNNQLHNKKNFLSNKLVDLIERNAELIAHLWVKDVTTNRSTPSYHVFDQKRLFRRVYKIISQFGQWLGGLHNDGEIPAFYTNLGKERKEEGFILSEVISALSLTKKHIWEFALSQGMWQKTIDIYMVLELDRRIVIFFDRAAFYLAKGYEH